MVSLFQIQEFRKLDSDEERIERGREIYDNFIMKELVSRSHVSVYDISQCLAIPTAEWNVYSNQGRYWWIRLQLESFLVMQWIYLKVSDFISYCQFCHLTSCENAADKPECILLETVINFSILWNSSWKYNAICLSKCVVTVMLYEWTMSSDSL